jgi:hypothetical protein
MMTNPSNKILRKRGKIGKTFNFLLSTDSWKKTFVSAIKPLRRFGPKIKNDAVSIYTMYDNLEATEDLKQLRLTVKLTRQTMFVYGFFAFAFAIFTIYRLAVGEAGMFNFQVIMLVVISAVFTFRTYADVVVNRAARKKISEIVGH